MSAAGRPGTGGAHWCRKKERKKEYALTGVAVRPRGALPLPLPLVPVALGGHGDLVGHQEGRVEAHAKLQV